MIDTSKILVYRPSWMGGAKRLMLEAVAKQCQCSLTTDPKDLEGLSDDVLPLICCTGEIAQFVQAWQASGRKFLYWDRGYLRRIGGLWRPEDNSAGYLRVNYNCFQMPVIKQVPDDRWQVLRVPVAPWHKGRNVVVATTDSSYWIMHGIENWLDNTLVTLREHTDRPVVVRRKDTPTPLWEQLQDAHCLVAHGSNAAIEAVVLGCPVIVNPISAAALVGRTRLEDVEDMVYPDRQPWLNSLAYSQFTEKEIVSGAVWGMI